MSDTRQPSSDHPGVLSQLVRARRQGPHAVLALREDLASDSRLGYGYLGIGAAALGIALFLRGLAAFVLQHAAAPLPVGGIIAWVLIAAAIVRSCLFARAFRGRLPLPAFAAVLVLLAVALTLDVCELRGSAQPLLQATTVLGVGATLLCIVGFRPARQLLTANAGFAAVLLCLFIAGMDDQGYSPGPAVKFLAIALLPPLIGALLVRGFGRLVQVELDRSLVESTLLAPRFAFGMRASDELARLDLDAEEILDGVASGALSLPLEPGIAASSSSIATELRLLLVAGRHDTWLHHAIDESEILGPLVTLSDPQGLAGYLEPSEREGLLSAIWLLVADSRRVQPTLQILIGPPNVDEAAEPPDRIGFPIALTVEGVPRRKIDPAVWPALDRVGHLTESVSRGRLTIVTTVRTVAQQVAG
jgi:hypothetical protein